MCGDGRLGVARDYGCMCNLIHYDDETKLVSHQQMVDEALIRMRL